MSRFENIGDAVASWIDDLLNSDMAPPSPRAESVEWDGSRIVIEYEEDLCNPDEPGEWYTLRWYVYVYLRAHDSVQSVSMAQDRVYESVDLDVLNCTASELLKAIRQACRCVPHSPPNQPDTPSLQDRYPDHPRYEQTTDAMDALSESMNPVGGA